MSKKHPEITPCWLSWHWALVTYLWHVMFICLVALSFISLAWTQSHQNPFSSLSCKRAQNIDRKDHPKGSQSFRILLLLRREQLYFHSFRFTSYHSWFQYHGLLQEATLLNVTSWVAIVYSLLTSFLVTISATVTRERKSSDFSCPDYSQILVGFGTPGSSTGLTMCI